MKNNKIPWLLMAIGSLISSYSHSQETAKIIVNDSLKSAIELQRVTVVSDSSSKNKPQKFNALPVQRTDEIVASIEGVTLIRRGNYAAEPTYRGMSSGQLSMTIDGMKIFGACTDKMDPVSSYVSSNNLESISVSSNSNTIGQSSNIAGGVNFETKNAQFNPAKKITGSAGLGYQTNGNGRIANLNLNYGDSSWAINANGNYQKFDNYTAGNGDEILYSQFEKVNFAISSKWMISNSQVLEAQFIYDDAYNVGYPALPMDVSFAGGRIYSLSYKKYFTNKLNGSVLLKAYGNNITHIMDDTKRAYVPMHMDMPGWSDTYGAYASGNFAIGEKHTLTINPDYYQNKSFADMVMYPNDPSRPNEPVMYMITWPDVLRHSGSLLVSDKYVVSKNMTLNYSGKLEYVTSKSFSEFGIKQLEGMGKDGTIPSAYLLGSGNFSATQKLNDHWSGFIQGGYAERQPTVSEGFGYYLFNSMDGYDYIGQPDLLKEKGFKYVLGTTFTKNKVSINAQVYNYQFTDYIIGEVDSTLDGMTIGSNGVKVYQNISSASISGFEVKVLATAFKIIRIENISELSYGIDNNGEALPLIPPFKNITKIGVKVKTIDFRLETIINTKQNHARISAGESATPAYAIMNLNSNFPFQVLNQKLHASVGVNNLFNANYWDHLDWNSIPRPGRSFVFNLKMDF